MNTHRRLLGLFLLYFLSQSQSLAQFSRDYIVTLRGDTLYGNVQYTGGKIGSNEMRFTSSDGRLEIYRSDELKAFSESGKDYVSLKTSVPKTPSFKRSSDRIFAERLISGQTELYRTAYYERIGGFTSPGGTYSPGSTNTGLLHFIKFNNGELARFSGFILNQTTPEIIFPEIPHFERNHVERGEIDLYSLVSDYNSEKSSQSVMEGLFKYRDRTKVNIVLFRRDSPLDDNQGDMTVKIGMRKIATLKPKQYLSLILNKSDWYNLNIYGNTAEVSQKIFGRKDCVFLLEVAAGDKLYVNTIDITQAQQYIDKHEEIEYKRK